MARNGSWLAVLLLAGIPMATGCAASAQDGGGSQATASPAFVAEASSASAKACFADHLPGTPPTKSAVIRIMNDNAGSTVVVERILAYAYDGTVLCDSAASPGSPESVPPEDVPVIGPHAVGSWSTNTPCMNRPELLGPRGHVRIHFLWSFAPGGRGVKNPPAIVAMLRGEQLAFMQFVECTPIWVHP